MIVIGIIILIILGFVYVALPLWAKLIVLVINSFIPDPIPVLDEVLMFAATINDVIKILRVVSIIEWMRCHKILTIGIVLGLVALIGTAVSLLFR